MGYHKEERTEIGYNTVGYGNIHARNIIAWTHPKWGKLRVEQIEGHNCGTPKAEVPLSWTHCKVYWQQVDPYLRDDKQPIWRAPQ